MHKRLFGLLVVAVLAVSACGPAATTAPSSATATDEPGESALPSAEGGEGQTLTMAMDGDISGGLSNAADNVPTDEATQFLYNGLYVYKDSPVVA
jgi:hypothetical protein